MNNFILPAIILTLVIGVIAKILQILAFRTNTKEIITEKDLDPDASFYSIASFKFTKIYSFTNKGLLLIARSSVLIPRASIINNQSLVAYKDIESIDIGQATVTIKFKKILSPETMLFRYNGGGIATLQDNKFRTIISSKRTLSKFVSLLDKHEIQHDDVNTTKKSATTAIILGVTIPLVVVGAIILLAINR